MNAPGAAVNAHQHVVALGDLASRLSAGTPLAPEVDAARERLRGPLRVAIAGRVKAGKSTLLNALVGERLAPTDAGECTRLVSYYREGIGYEVRAILRDGRAEPLAFRRNGALQVDLGSLPLADVGHLDIAWPASTLARMTLIDTPGLASLNDENSVRTQEFLALDQGRSSQADAVIYLMRHLHRSDAEFLDTFLDRSVGQVSPVNTVTVLSRADEIGACRLEAMESARRIANRYRADPELRKLSATVLPLAGLIAETGLTFREDEASALRALAAMGREELGPMLLSTDRFVAPSTLPISVETRTALMTRLGMFGLRLVLTEILAGRATSASDIAQLLVRASGLQELRTVLSEHFLPRAQTLKARSALNELRDIARRLAAIDPAAGSRLEAEVERVEASAHEFAEMRLAHLVLTESIRLSADEIEEVRRVGGAASPAERAGLTIEATAGAVQAAAIAGIERWRARAEDPLADRLLAEAAEIVARSYEGIYLAVRDPGSPRGHGSTDEQP